MSLNQFETDEQRAEALLEWLKENSGFLILLAIVIFGSIFGMHYYRNYKEKQLFASSEVYSTFFNQYLDEKVLTEKDVEPILQDKNETYISLASFALGKQKMEAGELDEAASIFEKALETEKNLTFVSLLKYRLAIVKFQQANLTESLALLGEIKEKAFQGVVKSLEGDIYVLQDKIDFAKIAYEEALNANPSLQYTNLKLNHIGGIKKN